MEWWLITPIILIVIVLIVGIHRNGYLSGHKDGYKLGVTRINKYSLKVNHSLYERIEELQGEVNELKADKNKARVDEIAQ